MEWISIKEKQPHKFEVVWIYWKGREVLLGCKFSDIFDPESDWYSFDNEKSGGSLWWLPISESLYKPEPPKE